MVFKRLNRVKDLIMKLLLAANKINLSIFHIKKKSVKEKINSEFVSTNGDFNKCQMASCKLPLRLGVEGYYAHPHL